MRMGRTGSADKVAVKSVPGWGVMDKGRCQGMMMSPIFSVENWLRAERT